MIGIYIIVLLTLGVVAYIMVMLESARESKDFVVTEYHICDNRLDGLEGKQTIVVISDLHSKIFGDKNRSLLASIRTLNPDIIVVAGDMLIGRVLNSCFVGEELLLELAKEFPVYYENGNHEQRMKIGDIEFQIQFSQYKERLEQAGIVFLENESQTIKIDDQHITFWGLEMDKKYFEKYHYQSITQEELHALLGFVEVKNRLYDTHYNILIAHNPVHADAYAKWGADLVLSGHLHGGMIRLPYIGGVITPQVRLFPRYSGGRYRKDNTDIIVSKGLGGHTVKVRVMNRPELVAVHLSGEK